MEYFKAELKTGLIVLICLGLVILLTVGITGTKTMGKTHEFLVLFTNISGLDTDAPVNYSGFEVGKVKSIRLTTEKERKKYPEYNIAVWIKINDQAVIREDSIIQIETLGYLGLKYIDISAGTAGLKVIKSGATMLGFTPQDINDIIEMIGQFIKEIRPKLTRIIDGIEKLVGPEGTITEAVEELNDMIRNADEVIVVNKDKIKELISNLNATGENLKEFSADIKEHPWKLLIKSKSKSQEEKEIKDRKDKTNIKLRKVGRDR